MAINVQKSKDQTLEVINEIQKQIDLEWTAFHYYTHLYTICCNSSFPLENLSNYFIKEAEEEKDHALSLINCLNVSYGSLYIENMKSPQIYPFNNSKYKSISKNILLTMFGEIKELEEKVNNNLTSIFSKLVTVNNMKLHKLLEDLMEEQINSLDKINKYITKIGLISENTIFMVDNIFVE